MITVRYIEQFREWQNDWNKFVRDVLHARLDKEQQAVVESVQYNPLTAVCSGTSRGKDFVAACVCLCFMYLTPKFDKNGELLENTKIAMTAPCYDNETEILTDSGWKKFADLTYDDKVAQLGEDNQIEFVTPTDIIEEPYIGELIGCRNKLLDFLVTPEHRCLFGTVPLSIEKAFEVKEYHDRMITETNGAWSQYKTARHFGINQPNVNKYLKIAASKNGFGGEIRKAKDIYGLNGRFCKKAIWNGGKKEDPDWFEFLGFWFAEGSATFNTRQRKYRITLTQLKKQNIDYVDDLIRRNKHRFKNDFHKYNKTSGGYNWELYQKDIAEEFIRYGKQIVRKIPSFIKNADVDSMKAFIHGFLVGDGSIDLNGSQKLSTASKDLANDLHEMCVKCGMIASFKEYLKRDYLIIHDGNNKITGRRYNSLMKPYYEIKLSTRRGEFPCVAKSQWYKQDYFGMVYCVTVPSGVVMVRRNGYNHWSGNTGRQVSNIMTPEVRRLFRNAKILPGRLVADDIRTNYEEWFLTGFKADEHNMEAWSGFHAVNTMFVLTEASGIAETIYNAIEGNLQGNSRMLIVFNPNSTSGYAARAMKSPRFKHFRLDSLNAENVVSKQMVIPGQVDYEWVKDKVTLWCTRIEEDVFSEAEGDFQWDGTFYRPNDLFRVKVRGMFPKVSEDVLIPYEWIEAANRRWQDWGDDAERVFKGRENRYGVDVAGMGRDSSIICKRTGDYVAWFWAHQSAGKADHMHVAGKQAQLLTDKNKDVAIIDTIGEGAGVYSRLRELGYDNAISCKYSEGAKGLTDFTGVYTFANMKAYLYWAVRDWLDPKNKNNPCLPPDDVFMQEATEIKWKFQSNGSIIIEPKEDTIERIGFSPDRMDALANTFYPEEKVQFGAISEKQILNDFY